MTFLTDSKSVAHYSRTIAVLSVVLLLLCSCGGGSKQMGQAVTSRDSMAIMSTKGITSLISENGVLKYRITTEEWNMFDRTDPPYWSFEHGVFLEVLDSALNVTSSIKADTAYYYSNDEKWELRSSVHAENPEHEMFDTQLLFWDQRRETVYSDAFISIRQLDQVIYGHGFESNQDFTRYTIRHTEGMFPVEEADTEQTG